VHALVVMVALVPVPVTLPGHDATQRAPPEPVALETEVVTQETGAAADVHPVAEAQLPGLAASVGGRALARFAAGATWARSPGATTRSAADDYCATASAI
jgi:hypothetical protein